MIYKNDKELQHLHIGDTEIQRVLLGGRLIWENAKVVFLGDGTTFDVSNIRGYENFTANNFFVRVTEKPSVSDRVTGSEAGDWGGINTYLNKSYNANTGAFSFNYRAVTDGGNSRQVGGSVYLVVDLDKAIEKGKVINLGSGRSWNIKNLLPNTYMNLTINNFAIQSATYCHTGNRYWGGTFTYAGYGNLALSYNQATGVLSGGNLIKMTNSGGGYIDDSASSILPFVLL